MPNLQDHSAKDAAPIQATVFLVDREPLYRWFATESLSRARINVLAAASLAEAAAYLRASGKVDLLIVDGNLLHDGLGQLSALREWSTVRLLVLDSDGDASPHVWGSVTAVAKPVDPVTFLALVSSQLRQPTSAA